MFIYVLKLHDEKYYVGRTENVPLRTRAHFEGQGASWTKKYRPIDVCETFMSHDAFDEDKTTLEYMKKYGVENVRGGSFCRVMLTSSEKNIIQQLLRGSDDACFKCGERGHFARDCIAYEPWSHQEDEQLREEHGRGMSVVEMSEVHRRSQGAIRSRLKRVCAEEVEQPLLSTVEEDENLCCCLI